MKAVMAFLFLLSLSVISAQAAIDVYEFEQPKDEARFRQLIDELRCPKCQNQNINDSNAPLAKDLKDRVYQLVNDGKSNAEITEYMVERYGEFVTYRPRMSLSTALLWGVPGAAGVLALLALLIRHRRSVVKPAPTVAVDEKRVQALLNKYTQDSSSTQDSTRE